MLLQRSRLVAVTLALAAGTFGMTSAVPAQATAPDILDRLRAIPGLTFVSEAVPPAPEYRLFFLTYRQPADHLNPWGRTFEQRFQLLHKATDRPMVLHTAGYNMSETAFRLEPTRLIDGNQVSLEHRFFLPSRPDPADWSKLTIWQEATDLHRLVTVLNPIYHGKWISTGASKGGMNSVYHRRFYPQDVDGTIAYVAPNDAHNRSDDGYDRLFDIVGTDPSCRAALEDIQRAAFNRRTELVNRYEEFAAANNLTFHRTFGSADAAFEFVVLDTPWIFWQYFTQSDCSSIPPATASTDEIFAFIDVVASWRFYTDQGSAEIEPYYYQAATQLGWPRVKPADLRDLLRYPDTYNDPNRYLPSELRSRHHPLPMIDIDHWVRRHSSQMLFVYGANDPWSVEQFRPSPRDSFTYTAPGANHLVRISGLPAADAAAATATLQRWAGVSPAAMTVQPFIPGLDDVNPDAQRRLR